MGRFKLIMLLSIFFLMTQPVFAKSVKNVILDHVETYQTFNSAEITNDILYYSRVYDVDPLIITALFTQESGFNMKARSYTGAIGIAQLQPETAAQLGVNAYNIHENIDGGIRYFSSQQRQFQKFGPWQLTYAVAAYNAGPGAVLDYNGVPPYQETQNHVLRIYEIHKYLVEQMRSTEKNEEAIQVIPIVKNQELTQTKLIPWTESSIRAF